MFATTGESRELHELVNTSLAASCSTESGSHGNANIDVLYLGAFCEGGRGTSSTSRRLAPTTTWRPLLFLESRTDNSHHLSAVQIVIVLIFAGHS